MKSHVQTVLKDGKISCIDIGEESGMRSLSGMEESAMENV
jgi:hypothetical protein